MDIVDGQIHLGPGGISEVIASMDAVGIKGAIIDEAWAAGGPGYALPNGAFRPVAPTAELASLTHPDRFRYLLRLDRLDPDFASVAHTARDASYVKAFRIIPGLWKSEITAFGNGDYDAIFAAVAETGRPLCIYLPANFGLLPRYLQKFPEVKVIIDHTGIRPGPGMREGLLGIDAELGDVYGVADMSDAGLNAAFDVVLRLSDYPNTALKWAHAPDLFGAGGYPNPGLRPFLRKAVSSFGADRIIWASDKTVNRTGESWAELAFTLINNPELSEHEKSWILGGSARKWFNWHS